MPIPTSASLSSGFQQHQVSLLAPTYPLDHGLGPEMTMTQLVGVHYESDLDIDRRQVSNLLDQAR